MTLPLALSRRELFRRLVLSTLGLSVGSVLAACQSLGPLSSPAAGVTNDSAPSGSQTLASGSSPVKSVWDQRGWKNGAGHAVADTNGGFQSSGGIRIQSDGSLTLSRLNAAADTLHTSLNGGPYRDIVVANSGNYKFVDTPFAQIRHQNDDHSMPDAQIYWGGPDGFDPQRTFGLPADRPSSVAVMDLNGDGILDIVLAGGGEFHPPYVNSRVYWGSPSGFSRDNYTALPTSAATGVAVADLNMDGYPELVFGNLGDYNFPFPPSVIYWGGPDGYSPDRRSELPTDGVGGLAVADLNQDGWLDIVFTSSNGFPPISQLMDYGASYPFRDSYIYLGGPDGFSPERRISLPTRGATGVKVADLNKNGYLDIVFANAGSFALPPLPDTYIYWGGPDGYSTDRRTDLQTNGASAVAVADVTGDGWLDLVLSVTGTYLYVGKPKFPNSLVYFGGPNGFSDTRRLELPTEASQGATITDVDNDGRLDIVFSQLGDFNPPYRPVKIYFNNGDPSMPFGVDRVGTLPGQISYGSAVVGPDDGGDHMSHGNLAIPRYPHADHFVAEGQLISAAYRGDTSPDWTRLEYIAALPGNSRADVEIETSQDGGASWNEIGRVQLRDGSNAVSLADAGIRLGNAVRYRLVMTSPDGISAPVLRSLRFVDA